MTTPGFAPTDPPAPEAPRRAIVPWIVIGIAVVGIFLFSAGLGSEPEAPEGPPDETAILAILEIQTKILLGLGSLQPEQIEPQLADLERQVGGPRAARAVAAFEVAILGPEGAERALELLAKHAPPGENELEVAHHAAFEAAIRDPESLTDAERADLSATHGWFGDMVSVHHLDPSDPERADVLGRSWAVGGTFLFAMFAGLAGIAVGVGLLIWFGVLAARKHARVAARMPVPTRYGHLYIEGFAAYVAVYFLLIVVPAAVAPTAVVVQILQIPVLVGGFVLGVTWPLFRGVPRAELMRDLGLHRGTGFFREIASGAVGYVAILPLFAAGALVTVVLTFVQGLFAGEGPAEPVSHPVLGAMAEGGVGVRLFMLALASLWAPISEEIMFRGSLYGRLRTRFGVAIAAILTSLVFAAIHPQGWVAIPALGALAVGFALVREWRGSMIAPMVAHAIHNGILVCLMWIALA